MVGEFDGGVVIVGMQDGAERAEDLLLICHVVDAVEGFVRGGRTLEAVDLDPVLVAVGEPSSRCRPSTAAARSFSSVTGPLEISTMFVLRRPLHVSPPRLGSAEAGELRRR